MGNKPDPRYKGLSFISHSLLSNDLTFENLNWKELKHLKVSIRIERKKTRTTWMLLQFCLLCIKMSLIFDQKYITMLDGQKSFLIIVNGFSSNPFWYQIHWISKTKGYVTIKNVPLWKTEKFQVFFSLKRTKKNKKNYKGISDIK